MQNECISVAHQHGRDRTLDTRDEQKSRENKIIFFPPPVRVCWRASVLLHLEYSNKIFVFLEISL